MNYDYGGVMRTWLDVTTQQDDESIRTKSDQFMEDWSEFDFEQIPNQEPLHVQKNFCSYKTC